MTEIGDVARLSRWIGESNVCGLLKGVQMSCAAVHPGHRLSPVAEPSMLRLIEFVVERVMRVACRTRETQLSANVIVIQSEDIKRGVCGNDAIDAVDDYGGTPLHWASSSRNELAMRVMVELGAEIDRQTQCNVGSTVLIIVSFYQISSVELLLALGADVNLVTNDGRTACLAAAVYRQPAALCALVAAGGDLDQPNKKGETCRMIATRNNVALPNADEIDAARRRIAKRRLDLVRERAFQICLGLQPLDINALQLCEILMHSFGALGSLIAFHQWWAIATKVKHFRDHN